jgi:hypothetical protein
VVRNGILIGALGGVLAVSVLHVAWRHTRSRTGGPDIDSNSLQQTVVVATLDDPLPEHKNAIWCATFQMAWDKLKQDIIGEPIQIPEAQELADRLNRLQFPTGSIEEKSYYAAAGFVGKGIIEQVQKEMKQRFPSEPVPTFDGRYKITRDDILAYAYLNVDVEFKYPYYTYLSAFDFQNSTGQKTGVTAFCAQTHESSGKAQQVRDQVEVLFYDGGQMSNPAQFAVDLCAHTQPYQVILACLPRVNTFREAAKTLQEKAAAAKNNPHNQAPRYLEPGDTLIVPDVLYKLTHHFDELLHKPFGNPKWADYFFVEALQKVDFTLSRTGVVLKSEAHLRATKSAAVKEPRRLHFDRPFLICVQKREPNGTPFFLMWVDNAELMQPYASSAGR